MSNTQDENFTFTCQTCKNIIETPKCYIVEPENYIDEFLSVYRFHIGTQSVRHNETADAFTLIHNSGKERLSSTVNLKARLSDLLTSNSLIDHPVCTTCVNSLCELMDKELAVAINDLAMYKETLTELEKHQQTEDITCEEEELAELNAEEKQLLRQIAEVKDDMAVLSEELEQVKLEEREVDEWGAKLCEEYELARYRKRQALDETEKLRTQIDYAKQEIEKLKNVNVFTATFNFGKSGNFATLNNFRLGYSGDLIDWSEVNAGFGQVALLLTSLANRIGLTFERYRIVPVGAFSYLEVLDERRGQRELPLYGAGSFKPLPENKFEAALIALLDCVIQFEQAVRNIDPHFTVPHPMSKFALTSHSSSGDSYSIRLSFNTETKWSKALDFMLTNLKWGLAWVCNKYYSDTAKCEN